MLCELARHALLQWGGWWDEWGSRRCARSNRKSKRFCIFNRLLISRATTIYNSLFFIDWKRTQATGLKYSHHQRGDLRSPTYIFSIALFVSLNVGRHAATRVLLVVLALQSLLYVATCCRRCRDWLPGRLCRQPPITSVPRICAHAQTQAATINDKLARALAYLP